MTKILYVVAQKDFRDEEFFVPKDIFEKEGYEVTIASNSAEKAIGFKGGETDVDLALKDAVMEDYDAIVIAGGKGAMEYLDGEDELKRLLFDAMRFDKIVAAICISPLILAHAGLLRKRVATVWNDENNTQAEMLKAEGCLYMEEDVVVDKNIITGNGPEAAKEFGESIVDKIKGFY